MVVADTIRAADAAVSRDDRKRNAYSTRATCPVDARVGRRDPQLLGTESARQVGSHPELHERVSDSGGQAGRVSRAVRGILRDATCEYGAADRRAAGRQLRGVVRE